MMLYLPPGDELKSPYGLGVAHVTLHTSIRSVPGLLNVPQYLRDDSTFGRILETRRMCNSTNRRFVALNPHAGEKGIFGDEESTLIAPAVKQAQAAGINSHRSDPCRCRCCVRARIWRIRWSGSHVSRSRPHRYQNDRV